MYQIKFKQLLLTTVTLLAVQQLASAASWIGDSYTSGNKYYIYDTTTKKFIGHYQSETSDQYTEGVSNVGDATKCPYECYPVMVDSVSADEFVITTGSKGNNSDAHFFRNLTLSSTTDYVFLNVDIVSSGWGLFKTSKPRLELPYYYSTTLDETSGRGYDDAEGSSSSGWSFYFNYSSLSTRYYITVAEKTIDGQSFSQVVHSSDDTSTRWLLISESQFNKRIDLGTLFSKVKGFLAEVGEGTYSTLEADYNNAKGVLEKTSSDDISTELQDSYELLIASYTVAVQDQDIANAKSALQVYVNNSESLIQQIYSKIGSNPEELVEAYTAAKTEIQSMTSTTETISDAQTNLASLLAKFSSPTVLYCGEMYNLSKSLGCPISETNRNLLLSKIGTESTDNINTFITSVQATFKNDVVSRVNAEQGFAINSDFTGFIMNNSFETKSNFGWDTFEGSLSQKSGSTVGDYYFTGTKLVQNVNNLPAGTYSLTGTVNNAKFAFSGDGVTDNGDGTFTVAGDRACTSNVTITISCEDTGSNMTVDDLKLTLLSGVASTYAFNETDGVASTEFTGGPYTTAKIKRTIKSSGSWNTLCLPFPLSKEEKDGYFSVVKTFGGISYDSEANSLTVSYNDLASDAGMERGTVYLVKVNGNTNIDSICAAGALINTEECEMVSSDGIVNVASFGYVGNFKPFANGSIPTYTGCTTYVLQQNAFHPVVAGTTPAMKAFRAYFVVALSNSSEAPSVHLSIDADEEKQTDIEILSTKSNELSPTYDMLGRKVNTNARGLYFQQGKKYIVK